MQDGDFLKIEYVGRIASTGEIFDLTDEALARKEGIHAKGQKYGPVLVILGSRMAGPGVEKNLIEMKPGEEREFSVTQDDGFGRRDSRLVKIISLQRFTAQKISPVPGIFLNIDGRHAKVQSVSGGRVRVDFNSPLAGKDLKYKVRLVCMITGVTEKASAFLEHFGVEAKVRFEETALIIETEKKVPEAARTILTRELTRWIPEAKKITFVSTADIKEKKGQEHREEESPGDKAAASQTKTR
jgi:FKBP-type peptidyl-prolyl cis-trans isomerase 2